MILKFDTLTVHNTSRIWIYGINEIKEKQYSCLLKIYAFLKKESAWNGADKEHSENGILKMRSWEVTKEKAFSVFDVLTVMVDKAEVDFVIENPLH